MLIRVNGSVSRARFLPRFRNGIAVAGLNHWARGAAAGTAAAGGAPPGGGPVGRGGIAPEGELVGFASPPAGLLPELLPDSPQLVLVDLLPDVLRGENQPL